MAAAASGRKASGGLAPAPGGYNPWIVAVVVALATFMEVLDTTIANVALRYISGGLAVGPDEASWVVTTYLVANAIVLCASSWISTAFGRRNFFLVCLALFTISSVLCGFAWDLQSLLFFRVLQGLAGGGMTPVAQSILASSFPPEKRGQAFALYGVAVVVAPVVGPTLGGWLSDNYSWHWCFLINGPVGLITLGLVWLTVHDSADAKKERRRIAKGGYKFDWIGFLLVATFLGALEVCLDEGQRDDWFGSTFIIVFALISASALVAFIPWELRHKNPLIDLRMLFARQFGSCFLVMMATGGILIATTQFVPQMLQEYYGYTATWAGLALSPGGVVTVIMMAVVGRLSGAVPAKYLIMAGALVIAAAMYNMTNLYGGLNFGWFVWQRMYIGIGLPLIFIPITAASYVGIPENRTDQASALINMARNTGGSIGVSIANNILMYRQQFHQNRLVEHVVPANPAYQDQLANLTSFFQTRGANAVEAAQQAFAAIGQTVQQQVGFLSYIDVYWSLCLMALAAVPLAALLSAEKAKGGAAA